jgi:hypothetical protein
MMMSRNACGPRLAELCGISFIGRIIIYFRGIVTMTKLSLNLALFSTLGSFILAACGSTETVKSSDVNETQYYRSYSLDYDADTLEFRQMAQFRVGGVTGTTIELVDPSKVNLLGKDQAFEKTTSSVLIGTFYSLTSKTSTPDTKTTFVWTRKDSTTTTDEIGLATAISAATKAGDTISKAAGYDVTLSLDAVNTDDSVQVTIASDATSVAEGQSRTVLQSTSNGHVVRFSSEDLSKLVLGSAKLTVKHTTTARMSSSSLDLGGISRSSYTTVSIPVTIAQ